MYLSTQAWSDYAKAFLVGSSWILLLWPFLYTGIPVSKKSEAAKSYALVPIYLPIIFGIANMLAVFFNVATSYYKMCIFGFLFGIFLSVVGTFLLDAPTKYYDWKGNNRYKGLIIAPFLYAAVWGLLGTTANRIVGIRDQSLLFCE